jgi:hypothetical protein
VPHFIVNIYHNYTIRQRVIAPPPPLSFFGAFMKPFYFFAGAERPQGVRRFLSSAGSGAQPPRFFFANFSSFSLSFFFFSSLSFSPFLARPIFCRLPAAINFFPRAAGTMHREPVFRALVKNFAWDDRDPQSRVASRKGAFELWCHSHFG